MKPYGGRKNFKQIVISKVFTLNSLKQSNKSDAFLLFKCYSVV